MFRLAFFVMILFIVYIQPVFADTGVIDASIPLPPNELPWYGAAIAEALKTMPDINSWFLMIMGFLMASLRAIAELLGFIALKTESKKDDRIALEINRLSLWAAKIVGWFGVGTPKTTKDK